LAEHGGLAEDGGLAGDGGGDSGRYRVVDRTKVFSGAIFDVVSDEVAMPDGGTARRDYTRNRGAAAIVALDEAGVVTLVRQYRHAVGRALWELPAGLIDGDDEPPVRAAARELAEEVDLAAGRWDLLLAVHASPGVSDEVVHVFLARDLTEVAGPDRHTRTHEESDLQVLRVDLSEAVAMVLRGEITNASTVAGLLAAARVRDGGWAELRSAGYR
jgi:ADP-ribose pyrophosphatase